MKGLYFFERSDSLDDNQIVDLYWERSENAICETAKKYSRYCHYIAFNILHSNEDSEECVNDAYLNTWNSIPPHRPVVLKTFLGKIVRNLSKQLNAEKRCNGQIPLIIDELQDCLPSSESTERIVDDMLLADVFNRFLASIPAERRKIFMRRYWYLSPIKDIAIDYNISESKVKMSLFRSRNELKQILLKEGISI